MPTKKTSSSEPQLQTKTPKASEKNKSPLALTQSLLNQSNSCSSNSSHKETKKPKSTEKVTQPGLPMSAKPEKTGCCMGTTSCGTSADQFAQKHSTQTSTPAKTEAKKGPKTRVVVRYDVGFNNSLSLRGKGANLCWDKGIPLKNIKNDEWIWETEALFNTCEFKVLINDCQYENGENHPISCGASIQYTPQFN